MLINRFACANVEGRSPFLVNIKPKFTTVFKNLAEKIVKIKNYEVFIMHFDYTHNSESGIVNDILTYDLGFTIVKKDTSNELNYKSNLRGYFKATDTKHSKYIYQSSVIADFFDFGELIINGTEYAHFCTSGSSCNLGAIGPVIYQDHETANQSFNLSFYVEDDGVVHADTRAKITVTLYYK